MFFVIVGKRQGQTFKGGSLGSPLHFKDGMIEVPDDAKDLHNLLANYYSAHPAHECDQDPQTKIITWRGRSEEGQVRPPFIPVALKELEGTAGAPPAEPPAFDTPVKPAKPGKEK